MQSIGFAPNVEGFGLDKAGVELTDRKAIAIDDYMRTNVAAHLRHRRRHRRSCSSPTSPRRRASSPPRPSPAPRRWRSATTG